MNGKINLQFTCLRNVWVSENVVGARVRANSIRMQSAAQFTNIVRDYRWRPVDVTNAYGKWHVARLTTAAIKTYLFYLSNWCPLAANRYKRK